MQIRKRLYFVLAAVFLVVMVGSTGYYLILGGETRFMDCLFMTVISLTSVGYGEVVPVTGNVPAQIYTMALIGLGMGVILYGISSLTALIIEGELSGLLRRKRMEKQICKLRGHYIVCGGGETGYPLVVELASSHEDVVVIERDPDKLERCRQMGGVGIVEGDATDDANLATAGLARAAGVVVCLPSDKDNLYITMTARMLNPDMRIISRMTDPKVEPKLKMAGADGVVSPNSIGALRMASEMIRPTVVSFLDSMLRSRQGNLRIHQLTVSPGGEMDGCSLRASGIKSRYNLLVLSLGPPEEDMVFNPGPDLRLRAGMILVVMGDAQDIHRARKVF